MSEYRNKIALGIVASVIVGTVFIGALYYLPQTNNATPFSTCYSLALPSNETTTSVGGNSQQILIFNVATYFDEGDWVSFLGNPMHVASYDFLAYSPNSTNTSFQLEPQLFVNVSESISRNGTQVYTQELAAWTDLGGFGGNNWPPELSPSNNQILFNGTVMMQFLFPCTSRSVFFEIVVNQISSSEV